MLKSATQRKYHSNSTARFIIKNNNAHDNKNFFEPICITTIYLLLRRTLVLQTIPFNT